MGRAIVVLALALAVVFGLRAPMGNVGLGFAGASVGCSSSGGALDPKDCAACHRPIADRYALSAHAKADDSPVFHALRDGAPENTRAFCDRCHSPRHDRGERGVGCLACHGVVGNQGTENARFIEGDDDTVQGPTGPTGAGAAHRTRKESFVTSAELCGTCHEVNGGGAFVETPYTEWSNSPAHAQGIACPKCHMAKTPGDPSSGFDRGVIAPNVPERDIGDHAFRAADGGLLDHAARLAITRTQGNASITLTNRNPAHSLPAGARFIRRLTLVVTSSDGATANWDLGDRLLENGSETVDPIAADGHEIRALDAATERTFYFAATGSVDAKLVYRSYDDRLLARLGLDPSLSSPRVIAEATSP